MDLLHVPSRFLRVLRGVLRQLRRQTGSENLISLMRLMNGSTLKYFWRREKFFRLRRKGEKFVFVRHEESWLLPTSDSVISPQLYAEGSFDLTKLVTAIELLRGYRLTTIIDVGAHIGSICIPAVCRGWFARAIAIEPDSINFSLLEANLLLNGVGDRVSVINAPVGGIVGAILERTDGGANSGDHRFVPVGSPTLEATRSMSRAIVLDSLFESVEPRGALLWMDIQGAEGIALMGSKKLLSREIPVVLEFDAKLLEPNGGISVGFELLANYEGFVDLGSKSVGVLPMSELGELYATSLESGASFDLLFLPIHSRD